jgi:hypothetical protein
MKRSILWLAVALLAFGFGVVIHRIFDTPKQKPRTEWKLDPVIIQPVAACPASTPAPDPTPTQYLIFDYHPVTFDPRGTYFPLTPLPYEFKDFELFEISSDEYLGKVSGSALVQVRTSNESDFQNANFLLITEKRLFFYAAPRFEAQYEYRFDGEFLGNPGRLIDTGKAAVRGTLTKMKNGRRIAERVVTFDVKYLGC